MELWMKTISGASLLDSMRVGVEKKKSRKKKFVVFKEGKKSDRLYDFPF